MIFQLVDSEDKVVDTIAAHKVIFAVHKEYFRAIFFGTGAFFKEGKDGIVVVKLKRPLNRHSWICWGSFTRRTLTLKTSL